MVRLSKRLALVARFADGAKRLADIGTDHGYIPVWFAKRGGMERIVASDVREGPLASAVATAQAEGCANLIEFRLADGLEGLEPDIDTVILAGMGGDLMVNILSACPWITEGRTLVLQPQTKTDRLTSWLGENGGRITDAELCEDAGKTYLVLRCETGHPAETPTGRALYALDALEAANDPLTEKYRTELLNKLRISINGQKSAEIPDEKAISELERLYAEIARNF